MKSATLAALKGSIAKWKAIVSSTGVDHGTKNCPLCLIFYDGPGVTVACGGCPVAEKSGDWLCASTPYAAWQLSFKNPYFPLTAETAEQKAAARAELKFLRSLLPKPKKPAKPAKRRAGR